MKVIPFARAFRPSYQDLFYLEQWIAFAIGLLGLAASAWAAYSGFRGAAGLNQSWFPENELNGIECLLAIAVALIGTALVRFAFHRPRQTKIAAPPRGQRHFWKRDRKLDTDGSTLLEFAAHKRRG